MPTSTNKVLSSAEFISKVYKFDYFFIAVLFSFRFKKNSKHVSIPKQNLDKAAKTVI